MAIAPSLQPHLRAAIAPLFLAAALCAQAPRPSTDGATGGVAGGDARRLAALGREQLDREDPVRALETFRAAARIDYADPDVRVGMGRCHLLLGSPQVALDYARSVLLDDPTRDDARALEIRALLRARRFREALERSRAFVAAGDDVGVETLAAHASALFRTQHNDQAASVYHEVLSLDPLHIEANLRLGSGLTAPCRVEVDALTERAVESVRRGAFDAAIRDYLAVLGTNPTNPVARRLLGEVLLARRAADSMATRSEEFRRLQQQLPDPDLRKVPVAEFMPSYPSLSAARREVAARGLALFRSQIPRLLVMGGKHDLIAETERTTDHASRANLRGRRTFDGRVWDDVRGVGGLRAATGIEALDEAIGHGFDTLAHEVAHQAHLYSFPRRLRRQIRELYRRAMEEGNCLDFYAASNDAEYFGQGVEAYSCLAKRPGYEVTHGHTRFELMRVDPRLYRFIQRVIDFDPLSRDSSTAHERAALLRAAVAAALRSGRFADAVTAAEQLDEGREREVVLGRAESALRLSLSY